MASQFRLTHIMSIFTGNEGSWFLSDGGVNDETCGQTMKKPCLTINWLLERFHSETHSVSLRLITDKSFTIDKTTLVSKKVTRITRKFVIIFFDCLA